MNNKEEFAHGYSMGWNYVKFEKGTAYGARYELICRGVSLRIPWSVGFRKGAQDAENGLDKKYSDLQ